MPLPLTSHSFHLNGPLAAGAVVSISFHSALQLTLMAAEQHHQHHHHGLFAQPQSPSHNREQGSVSFQGTPAIDIDSCWHVPSTLSLLLVYSTPISHNRVLGGARFHYQGGCNIGYVVAMSWQILSLILQSSLDLYSGFIHHITDCWGAVLYAHPHPSSSTCDTLHTKSILACQNWVSTTAVSTGGNWVPLYFQENRGNSVIRMKLIAKLKFMVCCFFFV